MSRKLIQRLCAEAIGTGFLLATIIGSGIMAERLAGGNVAIALLGNTIATGAILFVLIVTFGKISGAHFNPVVTLAMVLEREISARDGLFYAASQVLGGILGVWVAHMMFAEPVLQAGDVLRSGGGQWFAESVATFGLVLVILRCADRGLETVGAAVGLYITAAYWFTASTSFANPAVTIARGLSASFAGIRPEDAVPFIAAQIFGGLCAWAVARFFAR